jgi:hypothetical protein
MVQIHCQVQHQLGVAMEALFDLLVVDGALFDPEKKRLNEVHIRLVVGLLLV